MNPISKPIHSNNYMQAVLHKTIEKKIDLTEKQIQFINESKLTDEKMKHNQNVFNSINIEVYA